MALHNVAICIKIRLIIIFFVMKTRHSQCNLVCKRTPTDAPLAILFWLICSWQTGLTLISFAMGGCYRWNKLLSLKALSHWGNTAETGTHIHEQSVNLFGVPPVARQPCHIAETEKHGGRQQQCCFSVTAVAKETSRELCWTTYVAQVGARANFCTGNTTSYVLVQSWDMRHLPNI